MDLCVSNTERRSELGERVWTMVDLRDEIDRFATMLRTEDKRHGTIASYVTQAERFLNWLDGTYKPRTSRLGKPYGWDAGAASHSRYDPLRAYLRSSENNAERMTFGHIERILNAKLPPSARTYAHWWANDRTGNHAQAHAWMAAGRKVVQLDLLEQRVMFIKAERNFVPSAAAQFG